MCHLMAHPEALSDRKCPVTTIMPILRIGSAIIDVIPEFEGNPMPLSLAMPAVSDADLAAADEWLSDPNFSDTVEQSILALSWHSYLVRTEEHTVIIDTGLGNDKNRPDAIAFAHHRTTNFLGTLGEHGVSPQDVDLVICTHLHFDHVGWNTRLDGVNWVPTFPNARYVFSRADYEHFLAESEHDPITGPAFRDSVEPIVQAGLAWLAEPGQVLFEEGTVRLWQESAAGHSPGSILVRLADGESEAVFTGDVIHHPIQLVRPEITLAFEDTPAQAIETRKRILAMLADTGALMLPAHFTGHPVGRVLESGKGYAWEPVRQTTHETQEAH
jgi:glyoxylase-like metal-dependent hydrolase (beta-lactamase superfamily II)